ncbi:unnamed protein product [Caenorhabditis nigoni]
MELECNECISIILIRDEKYISNFCEMCDKSTFVMKYPEQTEKYMSSFYDLEKQTEEQKNAIPEVGRTWKDCGGWKVDIQFLFRLPEEDGLGKVPEAF